MVCQSGTGDMFCRVFCVKMQLCLAGTVVLPLGCREDYMEVQVNQSHQRRQGWLKADVLTSLPVPTQNLRDSVAGWTREWTALAQVQTPHGEESAPETAQTTTISVQFKAPVCLSAIELLPPGDHGAMGSDTLRLVSARALDSRHLDMCACELWSQTA